MMKKIAILLLCLPFFTFAQKKNLTFEQAHDIKYAKRYKNNTAINSYVTKDGLTIKAGDTLTIGNALIERDKYMFNDVFSYIVIGKTKATMSVAGAKISVGKSADEFKPLPHNYSGSKVIVNSLFVTHEKVTGYKLWPDRKGTPLYVSVFVKNPKEEVNSIKGFSKMLSHSRKTIVDIEKALSSGEIVNTNTPLSREEAIKKLKESKDLMELDLLSKEEYEKLKEKLTPIILGK